MKKIRWSNPSRTIAIVFFVLYFALLANIETVSKYVLEGSTIYCYHNEIEDAWWMNR